MYEKCVEAIKLWEERRDGAAGKFHLINSDSIGFLHRLVSGAEYDVVLKSPKISRWANHELSVLLEADSLNVEEVVKSSGGRFIGAWRIPTTVYPASDFTIYHDPFDFEGVAQHPLHGIVICKKNNERGRQAILQGSWSVRPELI